MSSLRIFRVLNRVMRWGLASLIFLGGILLPQKIPIWAESSCNNYESCLEESKSDVSSTKTEAISKLGRTRDLRALPFLIETAENDPSFDVQVAAVRALGIFGDSSAVPALAAFLGKDHQLQEEVIDALIQIGDKSASDVLVQALQVETARIAAIQGLAEIGNRDARSDLITLYRTTENDRIRGLSSIAIQRIHARWGPTQDEMGVPIYPDARFFPNIHAEWVFTTPDSLDRVTLFYQKRLNRSPLDVEMFKKRHEGLFSSAGEIMEGGLPEKPDKIFVVEEQIFEGQKYPSKIIFLKTGPKKTKIQVYRAAGPED